MKQIGYKTILTNLAALSLGFAIVGCGSDSNNSGSGAPTVFGKSSGAQIDQLARPAINEGLSINDATLNAYNSTPPSEHLSDAAAPVRKEIIGTLNAFANLGKMLGTTPAPAAKVIAGAFLPDVMRIDTRLDIPPGKDAYNAGTSGSLGILTGGRKLEDEAMDITLSFLVAGDATGKTIKDGVSYAGATGNPNQGHNMLNGQTTRKGTAAFPFVTTPN